MFLFGYLWNFRSVNCDDFIRRIKERNLTDYSLFVQKKQSNPSYCALSPHIISPYNRSKDLVFTTKNSQKRGSNA